MEFINNEKKTPHKALEDPRQRVSTADSPTPLIIYLD